jgi:cellulose synthase/poly-beta-1,6-N-acetylglucosamine synthase-like glycosyltransferase
MLTVASFLVTFPVAEIVASIALPQPNGLLQPGGDPHPRVAVLVPAHNEDAGLLPTLADIKAQMHVSDRLLVVADNCTDDTTAVAAAMGANVIERNDPDRKGKGYACLG